MLLKFTLTSRIGKIGQISLDFKKSTNKLNNEPKSVIVKLYGAISN